MSDDKSKEGAPYGAHCLPGWCQIFLAICHKIPVNNWLGKRLAFIVRKPVLKWNQSPVDVEVEGLKLRLMPKGNLSDKRLLTTPALLDGEERVYLATALKPNSVIVDIGANIGGYGLLLASQRKDISLVAVEAHPAMAARIQQHIDFNKMNDRCQCLQVAASPDCQSVRLFVDHENQGRNTLLQRGEKREAFVDVKGMTISDIMDASAIEKADLLKMDIEGFEFPVLEEFFNNAEKLKWPEYIQLEHEGGGGNSQAAKLALENGYQAVLKTRMNVVLRKV